MGLYPVIAASRRVVVHVLAASAIAATLAGLGAAPGVAAEAPIRRHAISTIGPAKQGPDFTHFDWVNPHAPKGGTLRLAGTGKFDSLNRHTYRGIEAPLSVAHQRHVDGLQSRRAGNLLRSRR